MQITKLTPSKRKEGRWLVHLEDGTLLRVGQAQMADFALYTGMELEGGVLESLLSATAAGHLRERAMGLVTTRPYARVELIRKLTQKGEDPAQAEEVADWLEQLGLLDDVEFAAVLVRHYSGKGYGPLKLKDELYRRGVPRALWDQALSQSADPAHAIDAFLQRKWKGSTPDQKECKRATDALARRGYFWHDISDGLSRYTRQYRETE